MTRMRKANQSFCDWFGEGFGCFLVCCIYPPNPISSFNKL